MNYYYLDLILAWIVNNINNIISAVSGIATIVASVVAIYTLKIWRKQQIYGTKFNVLMDLEDNYELLLAEYAETFNWIFQRKKVIAESETKSKEYRQKVVDTFNEDYINFSSKNKLAVYSNSYQLAYCRAKRIFPSIATVEGMKFSELGNFHDSCLAMIKKECFESKETENKLIMDFSDKFIEFGNSGRQCFATFRKSL